MTRAMRAVAERNPNATRVINRILVFTDSMSALDRPCSKAASMCGRTALIRLARWTKAGMRQRRAQDSRRSNLCLPAWLLTANT